MPGISDPADDFGIFSVTNIVDWRMAVRVYDEGGGGRAEGSVDIMICVSGCYQTNRQMDGQSIRQKTGR